MKLTIDQMTDLLHVAHGMPHDSTNEVFATAGKMAAVFERITNGHKPTINEKFFVKPIKLADKKKTRKRIHKQTMVTRKTLRERGLDYPTVADCAHDLVVTKGMKPIDAAKRMGFDVDRLRSSLSNYKFIQQRKLERKQRKENAERKA
jgi:hypothetical protein